MNGWRITVMDFYVHADFRLWACGYCYPRTILNEDYMSELSLSIEEVRAKTGIGRTKLYQAINAGTLKAKKFNKRTIVLKDDLDAFLSSLPPYPTEMEGGQ